MTQAPTQDKVNKTIIPRIWQDVLIKAVTHNLIAPDPFAEALAEWEKEHTKRMAEDPEYAREHEEFERQWIEDNERWAEEGRDPLW